MATSSAVYAGTSRRRSRRRAAQFMGKAVLLSEVPFLEVDGKRYFAAYRPTGSSGTRAYGLATEKDTALIIAREIHLANGGGVGARVTQNLLFSAQCFGEFDGNMLKLLVALGKKLDMNMSPFMIAECMQNER